MNERNERTHAEGSGHPLPNSAEAHSDDIPEHLVREKGLGDDAAEPIQPQGDPVAPDGEAYKLDEESGED